MSELINVQEFVNWHESVIRHYPYEIQSEFRSARTKMIAWWYKSKSAETPKVKKRLRGNG